MSNSVIVAKSSNGVHAVSRIETIEMGSFLARISDPQKKAVAKHIIQVIESVRAGDMDTGKATFIIGAYKELMSLIAADNKKKVWGAE